MNETLYGVLIGAVAGAVPSLVNLIDAALSRRASAAARRERDLAERREAWRRRARAAYQRYLTHRMGYHSSSERVYYLNQLRPFVGREARTQVDILVQMYFQQGERSRVGVTDERRLDDAVLADIGADSDASLGDE